MVGDNIVSGQSNRPVMGIIQDSLLASYKMTHDDIFITKADAMNLIMKIRKEVKLPPPCIIKPKALWSGKQLFSLLFPEDLSYKRGDVEIDKGYYCQGVMSKKHLGTSERGMIHTMWLEYGPEYTTFFISNTQFLVNHWLFHHGFTVGIGDAITSKSVQQRVKSTIKESEDKVRQFISVSKHSNMEDIFEKKINQVLNNAMAVSGRIVQDTINRKNNIYTMVNGGSKGSVINIAQIMGVVGQQNVNGQRITLGNEDRTLCHFEKNDNNPAPKGFVKNSYYKGLDPHEFFYHAMGGREGIIDTAVKSITGDSLLMIDNGNGKEMITIGDFVDGYLEKEKENVVYYDEKNANMELLNISGYKIATIDSYGNSSWEEITKITRHDPSEYIYKIKTKFGREVRVVESKSLLVWNGNTYEPKMTNEVVVGDILPTLAKINDKEIDKVDIKCMFDSDKYIYGTRYQGDDSVIKSGYIYPRSARRNDVKVPETFELTYENGLFIGIYLAEGNCDIKCGKVSITNKDNKILKFCEEWFSKHGMKYKTYSSHGGSSVCIQGYSRLMGIMLENLCGKRAENKYIYKDFYNSNEKFRNGLLSGYFAGDGTVGKNSISCSSASRQLIYGIQYLLNLYGVQGKFYITKTTHLNAYRIDIRSIFAQRFCENIDIFHDCKYEKQKDILTSKTITKYKKQYVEVNDTIQDPIISIEKELSNGEKVYDLTIPETNNFGLANGLMVYDTADTGYIQRRLVKSMEDLKVHRDYSLRNSIGDVVQFFYGDDRMNPVYVRGYTLHIPGEEDFSDKERVYIEKYGGDYNSEIKISVPFDIEYQLKRLKKKNTEELITYEEWETSINSFCDGIVMNVEDECMSEHLEASSNYILLYVRVILSSKNVMEKHKLSNEVFNELLENLDYYFRNALVAPGEMMGTIAAQSLGEPTTQLTLNSFHFSGISAKNITLGVPRFKELINVLKNVKTPTMTLYVDDIEDVERVSIELENCILGDLITEVYNVSKLEAFDMDETYIDGNYMDTAIKVVLNKRAILDRKIEYIDISISLLKNGLQCVCNDEKYDDMYVIVLLEEKDDYNDDEYIEHIYTLLYNKIHIKGYEGISKCYISENNIETDGTCLGDVFMNASINYKKSISNIPIEVLEILGIEATRILLMDEIRKVLEFDGGYINPKHFCTLVDVMTHKGYLMSITRHGINKNETGPLMRCSFEETMDVLTDASTYAEKDNILGVSESITIGKMCELGTGMCDIIMNSVYDENNFEIEELSDEETESYYPCYEESYYPE